jgi:acetoin utilization deacetylase AcuC-like enzyme
MRDKVTARLIPQLTKFAPDLLFISAGFDAHYDDLYHYLRLGLGLGLVLALILTMTIYTTA